MSESATTERSPRLLARSGQEAASVDRSAPSGVIALAGLHQVPRGAEIALESIASQLADLGHPLTLIGGGDVRPGTGYGFESLPGSLPPRFRSWPKFPPFREEESWAAAAFALKARRKSKALQADYSLTCSFPFEWAAVRAQGRKQLFVTQNGDWCAHANRREYRAFSTDGLICTNPEYFERNKNRWNATLIPNGVDVERFSPGEGDRERLGLPEGPLVVIVSALIESKRVEQGLRAVAKAGDCRVAVFGRGVLEDRVDAVGRELFGDGYLRSTLDPSDMPELYRSADLLLHMSQNESFGNIYIEALACGLPVVAHRSTLTEWIYRDASGAVELVDTNSLEATAFSIQRAFQEQRSAQARQAAGQIRSRFSWSTVGRSYDDFIRQVVGA